MAGNEDDILVEIGEGPERFAPAGNGGYTETVLYYFPSANNFSRGFEIYSPVLLPSGGLIYGTTVSGGANDLGVIYEIRP